MDITDNHKTIFLIGSKLNDEDSIIVKDQNAASLLFYDTFEKAKESFASAYKILLAPSFRPSHPPSAEELCYHSTFMALVAFSPVILEFDRMTYKDELIEWRKGAASIFRPEPKFYNTEYWHCPMRNGFIDKFGLLNIAQDIETTPFIEPDGKMVVRINQVSRTDSNGQPLKQITREEIDKILKERGYL
ncbi:hypothetical protein [Niabella beijingensis]|uniref:hypothetical protein n=1 Tax=Niabella beijingensis TaxID=2872700 RepID=UPI001CBD875C|nr:hypothetical protein [Niabella beijingensis]MBZ4187650.1 hypothetical protein [Niabella beijingensis]